MRPKHRNEIAYPRLWKAVDGAVRATVHAHPENQIPNRASLVKRVVGQVLALDAGTAEAVATGGCTFPPIPIVGQLDASGAGEAISPPRLTRGSRDLDGRKDRYRDEKAENERLRVRSSISRAAVTLNEMLNYNGQGPCPVSQEQAQRMWDAVSDRHGFAAVSAFLEVCTAITGDAEGSTDG